YEMVCRAQWWRKDAIQVGRQEACLSGEFVWTFDNPWSLKRSSGIAYQHPCPIKHKGLRKELIKHSNICGHVIAIRPDAELGIILYILVREMKVVAVPPTGSIT